MSRAGLFLGAVLSVVGACTPAPNAESASASAASGAQTGASSGGNAATCSFSAQRMRMTSTGGCAESFWTFASQPDGSVTATEQGCANATGVGRWENGKFVVRGTFDNTPVRYEWTFDGACANATGSIYVGDAQSAPIQGTLGPAPAAAPTP